MPDFVITGGFGAYARYPNSLFISDFVIQDSTMPNANALGFWSGGLLVGISLADTSTPPALGIGTFRTDWLVANIVIGGGAMPSTLSSGSVNIVANFSGEYYSSAVATGTMSTSGYVWADAPLVLPNDYDELTDGDFWEGPYTMDRVALNPIGLESRSIGSSRALLRSVSKLLLLNDIALNIYSLWGFDGLIQSTQLVLGRDRIAQYCNTAMQLIYSNAARLDYFNRKPFEILIGVDGSRELPQTIQRIQGAARIGPRALQSLASMVEVEQFEQFYDSISLSDPICYYAESQRLDASDSVNITLHVRPKPAGDVTVTLDVVMEPQRFDGNDITQAVAIYLPHLWVESLFLPIVRKLAAGDNLMNKAKLASVSAEINSQYESARQMLGLADSAPPAIQRHREEALPA
jgi:hypothetical protein